jgi:hypothetical protein
MGLCALPFKKHRDNHSVQDAPEIGGTRDLFASGGSDALYQGTTLVGP